VHLLDIQHLTVIDPTTKATIVDDISFTVEANSCLGIVGESGSGKSMTMKAILGLIHPKLQRTGTALFDNLDLLQANKETLRKIRGRYICMIPQDAMSSFSPLSKIGAQMVETLCENLQVSKKEAKERSIAELERMLIRESAQVFDKYPHQLSGGMLQRCMIAIALAMQPAIIIADEPTTALDSINQQEVVTQFQQIRKEFGTTIIFISHDLSIVKQLAQRVLIMRNGRCVEAGTIEDVFSKPQHDYTKHLVNTRLQLAETFTYAMDKG